VGKVANIRIGRFESPDQSTYQAFRGNRGKNLVTPIRTDSFCSQVGFLSIPLETSFTLSGFSKYRVLWEFTRMDDLSREITFERDIGILENWIAISVISKSLIIMNDPTENMVFEKCCKKPIRPHFRFYQLRQIYKWNAHFILLIIKLPWSFETALNLSFMETGNNPFYEKLHTSIVLCSNKGHAK